MSAPIIPDEFMEWFRKNYPGPETIIHKPDWHAPRVYQAAIHASRADLRDPARDARVQALEAENARLKHALVVWDAAHRTGRNEPLVVAFETGAAALRALEQGEG